MLNVEVRGPITIVRMERGKGNALNLEFTAELLKTLKAVQSTDARAVVLTGSGSSFCAGVDLTAMVEGGSKYVHEFVPLMEAVFECLARFPKPLVAAVNGHAVAGGAVMMFAADHRILGSSSSRIGLTELIVGVQFPAWALEIARFAVPAHNLSKVVLTGKTFSANESLSLGLVDELVEQDELIERAVAAASALAAIDPQLFSNTKSALRAHFLEAASALAARSNRHVVDYWASEETLQVVAAFNRNLHAKKSS